MYNKKHTTANFLTTLLSALSLFTKASIPTANKAIAKAKKARPSLTTIYPSLHHLKPRLHAHRKAADNDIKHCRRLIIALLSSVLESVAIIFHIAVAQYERVDQQLICTVVALLINSLEVVS